MKDPCFCVRGAPKGGDRGGQSTIKFKRLRRIIVLPASRTFLFTREIELRLLILYRSELLAVRFFAKHLEMWSSRLGLLQQVRLAVY